MSDPYVDTNVIIRLLTGDDPLKQARARGLFQQVERGGVTVVAPVTVIADAVFVLSSPALYRRSRAEIAAMLMPLVRLLAFRVQDRPAVLQALQLYATNPGLDFGDALIAASMRQTSSSRLYSYDTDFDRIPGITREEP